MTLRNTPNNYGSIAKWLHWGTALLFLGSYVTVYYRQWFTEPRTPASFSAMQLHLSFGISIAVVLALRVIWRSFNPPPAPEPGTKLAHAAAKAGHLALYAVMILMPLTGYLGTGVDTQFFFLFDIPNFKDSALFQTLIAEGLGLDFKTFERPFDFLHKDILGAWLVWLLILGHALAALYHHVVERDRTLRKMTTGAP